MRRNLRSTSIAAFLFACCAVVSGCGEGGVKPPDPPDPGRTARVGVVVGTNSLSFRTLTGTADARGVVVLYAQPGGPADKAGIERGDLITSVDGQPATNAELAVVELRSHPREERTIGVVHRGGRSARLRVLAQVPAPTDLRAAYTALIDQAPNDPLLHLLRGQADVPFSEYASSIRDLDRAIVLDSRFVEAYAVRAERRWDIGRELPAGTPRRIAIVRQALGDWSTALRLDGQNTLALTGAAQAFSQLNRADAGLASARAAVKIDDRLPSAHYAWGLAEVTVNHPAQAAVEGRKAIDLNPYDVRYYELLATAFRRLNKPDDCTKTLNAIFTLMSDTQTKARLLHICS